MSGQRLTGLDGLRGIAAIAVLAHHVLDGYGTNAFLAVDFFFMLSGYVMARTYEPRLGQPGSAGFFMTSRLAKLWPTVFLASLITVPWLWARAPGQAGVITVANLLLLPTPSTFGIYILNPPAWSILVELVANAVHAAVLWRLSTRRLMGLAALLAALLAWIACTHGMNFVTNANVLGLGMARVLCPYVLGIVMYRTWRDSPPFRVPAWLTWTAMPFYFVAGTCLWNGAWLPDLLFVLVLCPVLIAGGLGVGEGSRLTRFLAFWGAVSFPLYAIHGPLLIVLRSWGVPLMTQFLVCLGVGVAYTYALGPVNRWIGRAMKRFAAMPAQAAAPA